jgi:hypothetical protein
MLASDRKQFSHTPLTLTGVVHLLYLFPQLLQIATLDDSTKLFRQTQATLPN